MKKEIIIFFIIKKTNKILRKNKSLGLEKIEIPELFLFKEILTFLMIQMT